MSTSDPVVVIDHLALDFQTPDGLERVLRDVHMEIHAGEIVGLVGESGCGKSATAKLLLGVLPMPPARIASGRVTMFGKDIATLHWRERELAKRYIAYVPQDPMAALNPSFTVGEQMLDLIIWEACGRTLAAYAWNRRRRARVASARDRAIELLEKVYIADPAEVLGRYPVQLSGGMRQRVLLAMALSGKPRLMIADEPTTALDVTVQKRTIDLIKDLAAREGLAGLYITHDLGVAREICARTYVMYGGTTVESGPTAALLEAPAHPYTQGLLAAQPDLGGGMPSGIPGQVPDYLAPPPGCRFAPRCGERSASCEALPAARAYPGGRTVACWARAEEVPA
ncbi:ABC transporter ATP-binding protein [Verticiella sediminum]|uniref:ABC transporter ATP-binding protein n=1 Tax=Verticiella sediminum TaxID=1247510 RepID=A0A556AGX0_9BURK|nr:ABC transporter ATP-binding protein [Verticiella sediminum]TSH92140.1 ABC transporter ATP-binding protein [Verticiella sediminum]